MRISRNFDDNSEPDPEHGGNFDHGVEILFDELDEFLAAAAAAGPDSEPDPQRIPTTPPAPPANLLIRLVKHSQTSPPVEDENLSSEILPASDPGNSAEPHRVPRWVRVALPRSAVVVALTGVVIQGQPAVIAVPVGLYGTGWACYLAWNAAYRPPLAQIVAATADGITHVVIALTDTTAHMLRAAIGRARSTRKTTPTPPIAEGSETADD